MIPLRIPKIPFLLIAIILVLTLPANAEEYSFTWDPNPLIDNVTEYRIYFRPDSGSYNSVDRIHIQIPYPSFDPDAPTFTFDLVPIGEEYCFVATAVNSEGYEGLYSDEAGDGETCGTNRAGTPTPTPTPGSSGTDGASGGGCFISSLLSLL